MTPELCQQLTLAILDHSADPASLNRRHWEAHGSDLASFLGAHPVPA
jgi:hypothetical protein